MGGVVVERLMHKQVMMMMMMQGAIDSESESESLTPPSSALATDCWTVGRDSAHGRLGRCPRPGCGRRGKVVVPPSQRQRWRGRWREGRKLEGWIRGRGRGRGRGGLKRGGESSDCGFGFETVC